MDFPDIFPDELQKHKWQKVTFHRLMQPGHEGFISSTEPSRPTDVMSTLPV